MSGLIIALDVVMVVTLPLYFRIVYVLTTRYRKINLDPSFHTLMINTCTVNILFSIVYIFIQEPASAGLFFEFYKSIGVALSSQVNNERTCNSTLFNSLNASLQLVLGLSRLTAIAFPLNHVKMWTNRRLFVLYGVLWTLLILASIPLLLPGSTTFVLNSNVYGSIGLEFALLGNYYMIYAVGNTGIAAVVELLNILCYVGMCMKYHSFMKVRGGTGDAKKLTRGVMRTTMAAFIISSGTWLLIAFFLVVFGNIFATGRSPFTKLEFSVLIRLLNIFNNVLTAWVLVATFSKVRRAVIGFSLASGTGADSVGGSQTKGTKSSKSTKSPVSKIAPRNRF
ncbi:hypothetical protein PRIPAC_91273 [Pristionchus pacificus]|uniref:G protein-coupled receptor n=1 Tax=Pristionchus pacificus TaxID=54126 RepID=A0A2A6B8E0_PRIPA|nr:hypothetical protein PRIPAC_91273 [Pristionchus pacificus]|eukprot:PDM62138.1 G protein-coupled receptor [Pristionchus pacificus]